MLSVTKRSTDEIYAAFFSSDKVLQCKVLQYIITWKGEWQLSASHFGYCSLHDTFGTHLESKKRTIETELEKQNFKGVRQKFGRNLE